ncbi:hypothetical protein ACH4LD_33205 [Streptomyces sp. NPDC017676]
MLAAPVPDPALPAGWAAEVKWDGWRAAVSVEAAHIVLRSRRGTNLLPAFPEVRAGCEQLPDATALDGELVVWEAGRLAFERLQGRLRARGAGAARLAGEWPAHFVAFDGRLQYTGRTTKPPRLPHAVSPFSWPRAEASTRGRAGPSPPDGAAGKSWTSPWYDRSSSWKSGSTSPATAPAGGGTRHDGIARAPTSLPAMSHPSATLDRPARRSGAVAGPVEAAAVARGRAVPRPAARPELPEVRRARLNGPKRLPHSG